MINKVYDEKICAWLDANRDRIVQEWMDLVRIPSVKGEAQPDAPFGVDCARAVHAAADNFARRGIDVRIGKNNCYGIAHIGSGEKCISIFGHSDVVPTGDGWLFTEPFDPIIKDGMLIGRGASDNKSGVMASTCILSILKECDIPVHNRIQAYIGSNEESGMGDILEFVKNEPMPDLSLVPDSGFPCSLGEKGILHMWAKCDQPFTAILDMQGGNAFNIVLDRVTTRIAPNDALAKELQEKCAGCKEYVLDVEADGTICLQAIGVAQHAAYPSKDTVNATWLTAKLLCSCENLPESDKAILHTPEIAFGTFYGEGLGIAFSDPEFGNLTTANGMVAVEDGHMKASLDVRYGADFAPDKLEALLHQRWQELGWQIVYMNNRPGVRVDRNSPVPEMFKGIYQQLSGKDTDFYFMQGGTYSRYLKNAFTVGTSIVAADRQWPGTFLPAGRGGAHQRDEAIDIEGFFLAVRVLTHYVIACDEHLANS